MRITIVLLSLLALLVFAPGCGKEEDQTPDVPDNGKEIPDKADLPEKPEIDPGIALVEASCTECHEMDTVTGAKMSHADWAAQVEGCMSGKDLDEEDAEKIVGYLATKYGE
jgi:cytochrome c5